MNSIEEKERALLDELKSYGALAIAYSGGVDSTYLADCAHEMLGRNAMMVIADSPSIPREELQEAVDVATERDWNLRIIQTSEHLNDEYLANEGGRGVDSPESRTHLDELDLINGICPRSAPAPAPAPKEKLED